MTLQLDAWDLQVRLRQIAGDVAKPGFYLSNSEDKERWEGNGEASLYVYTVADFCEPCVDLIVALLGRLRSWSPETESFETPDITACVVDGENDSSRFCHWCSEKLDCALSDYAALEEMAHFEEHPPDGLIPPADAYDLDNILGNGSATADFIVKAGKWVWVHDEIERLRANGEAQEA